MKQKGVLAVLHDGRREKDHLRSNAVPQLLVIMTLLTPFCAAARKTLKAPSIVI